MARYIVKLTDPKSNVDYFLEWSTIVDAPVTYGMSEIEFREYYREYYGTSSDAILNGRLDRVNLTGISAVGGTLNEVTRNNRAGENETNISLQEILENYCINHASWRQ